MFELNQRLASDTFLVGDLKLSRLLLMNDSRYPWLILVPRREDITEIHQLDSEDRQRLLDESCRVAEFIMDNFDVTKMNVAALGNVVPQLHLHHIGRHEKDPAWPGPVWGHSRAEPYSEAGKQKRLALFDKLLNKVNQI